MIPQSGLHRLWKIFRKEHDARIQHGPSAAEMEGIAAVVQNILLQIEEDVHKSFPGIAVPRTYIASRLPFILGNPTVAPKLEQWKIHCTKRNVCETPCGKCET